MAKESIKARQRKRERWWLNMLDKTQGTKSGR